MRQVSEKVISKSKEMHVCFTNLEKVFEKIRRNDILKTLKQIYTIEIMRALCKDNTNFLRISNEESRRFQEGISVNQDVRCCRARYCC